jgi:hypothetical protein
MVSFDIDTNLSNTDMPTSTVDKNNNCHRLLTYENECDMADANDSTDTIAADHTFHLPEWLANNQPIPDEVLAQRSLLVRSTYPFTNDDNECVDQWPSSFYAFSFVDLFDKNIDDTWSTYSSTIESTHENDRTCSTPVMNDIRELLNDIVDRVDTLDDDNRYTLNETILDEFWQSKCSLNDFYHLLDRLIDDRRRCYYSWKTIDEHCNEIRRLIEQIEHERTLTIESFDNEKTTSIDNDCRRLSLNETVDMSFLLDTDDSLIHRQTSNSTIDSRSTVNIGR